MTDAKIARDEAERRLVRDVMVRRPKTIAVDATVADVRVQFQNPSVQLALLSDGARFAGAIGREDVSDSAADDEPARGYARRDVPAVAPDASMRDALDVMEARGDHRLVVLDADGETLAGLLCLDRDRAGFCVEGPVAQAP
jgi:CBS domain-containing protein